MKFFIPHAENHDEAESVFNNIIKFNNAPIQERRIAALSWEYKGMKMSCEIGGLAPAYYKTGCEPVIAILDCGLLYKVCTTSRGVIQGEAILVEKTSASPIYFDV